MSVNYSRRFEQRLQQRLADEQREREEREAAEQEAADEQKRANQEARDTYRAGLAAEKEARRKQVDAEWDERLAPEKVREMRRWLAEHPSQTEADFKKAWIHLRINIIEDRQRAEDEAQMAAMRASGNYRM